MTYEVLAWRDGDKSQMRVPYPSYSEAWMAQQRLLRAGWRAVVWSETTERESAEVEA